MIERVRYDGLMRCSRPFDEDGAARVMLSQLGPGVVRGDRVEVSGSVGDGAHLIVTEQTSTRILGGVAPSHYAATWTLGRGARLEVRSEPLIAHVACEHAIDTRISLEDAASVLLSESAFASGLARVDVRTIVTRGVRELLYDNVTFDATTPQAVGTFAIVGRDVEPTAFDLVARELREVRIGVGVLREGIFARILASEPWPVREALLVLRAAWHARNPRETAR